MNYGLYMACSGVLTNLYRQDVASNNLANIVTTGYKPDLTSVRQRDAARIEDGLGAVPSNRMLERLGAGVMMAPNRVSFEQGPLRSTGDDLDLAIQGEGFFVLRDETDATGDRFRLTRDGRFTRDERGRMVSATLGLPLMDMTNRPIVIPDGPQVVIGGDGVIRQGDIELGRIQLSAVPDKTRLKKLGHSQFLAPADQVRARRQATGQIQQGMVEEAAVDPVQAMMAITDASRDAEGCFNLIGTHDRLMDRAINTLGRVS